MKLQCDLCREIVAGDFVIAGDAIEVRCPSCAGTFTVPASRPRARVAPTVPPALRPEPAPGQPGLSCPKCGDVQPAAAACRTCGLLADRMAEFTRAEDATAPAELVAAWTAVEAAWDDASAHARLLDLLTPETYAWAAARYRRALRARPDDAIAAERIVRITRMAEAALLASAPPPVAKREPVPYQKVFVVLALFIVLTVVAVGYTMLQTRDAKEHQPPSRGRPAPTAPARPAPHIPTPPPK